MLHVFLLFASLIEIDLVQCKHFYRVYAHREK